MGDMPLNLSVILDTEDDIGTTIFVSCNSCGIDLEVTGIIEEAEVGITLQVEACDRCMESRYQAGFADGSDHSNDRNYRGF